jgi:hypothetical protein
MGSSTRELASQFETLRRCLAMLPADQIAQDVELLVLLGHASLHGDPPAAGDAFRRALERFTAAGDATRAFQTWVSWTDAVAFALAEPARLDEALAALPRLSATFGVPPPELSGAIAGASFVAAFFRAPERGYSAARRGRGDAADARRSI